MEQNHIFETQNRLMVLKVIVGGRQVTSIFTILKVIYFFKKNLSKDTIFKSDITSSYSITSGTIF